MWIGVLWAGLRVAMWIPHVHVGGAIFLGVKKKHKQSNKKHINIFLTALAGQSSQGRILIRPWDKRDKIAISLWN